MCLSLIDNEYPSAKELFGDKDVIVCYKILNYSGNGMYKGKPRRHFMTPYRGVPVKLGTTALSNRTSKRITRGERRIRRIAKGIHVYYNLRSAMLCLSCNECVVRVFCKKEDYVAHNVFNSAVFMKVKYDKRVLRYSKIKYE